MFLDNVSEYSNEGNILSLVVNAFGLGGERKSDAFGLGGEGKSSSLSHKSEEENEYININLSSVLIYKNLHIYFRIIAIFVI